MWQQLNAAWGNHINDKKSTYPEFNPLPPVLNLSKRTFGYPKGGPKWNAKDGALTGMYQSHHNGSFYSSGILQTLPKKK